MGHGSNACGQRGWKAQPGGGCDRIGDLALDRLCAAARSWRGRARRRSACACRDGAALEQLFRRRHLDDAAQVHDADARRHVPDHGQVVADEEIGQVEAGPAGRASGSGSAPAPTRRARDVGSSHTMNSGLDDSARAMQMRWRWPPENSCGYLAPSAGSRPTRRSSSPTRCSISWLVLGQPEGLDGIGDDALDAPARVEAGEGVLEDHLQAPPQLLPLALRAPSPTCRCRRW